MHETAFFVLEEVVNWYVQIHDSTISKILLPGFTWSTNVIAQVIQLEITETRPE